MRAESRTRIAFGPRQLAALATVLIAGLGVARGGAKRGAEKVHRETAEDGCLACHRADAATLRSRASSHDPMLADDLDARCAACHDPLDASHRTGVTPKRAVPPSLPLSAEGKITCATCHFMHGENDAFGDFVRIDNRKGGLCLTCHELRELE